MRRRNTTPYLITAKYPATCHCGKEIAKGDEALFYPGATGRKVECRTCATKTLGMLDDERMASNG